NFLVRQETRDPLVEIGDLIFGISVVETKHRNSMRDLSKCLERRAADALCRRVGRDQVRKFRFKIDKFFVKPVVVAIADYRGGLLVIEPVWGLCLGGRV